MVGLDGLVTLLLGKGRHSSFHTLKELLRVMAVGKFGHDLRPVNVLGVLGSLGQVEGTKCLLELLPVVEGVCLADHHKSGSN